MSDRKPISVPAADQKSEKPDALAHAHLAEGLASAALAARDWQAVALHCSRIVQLRPDYYEAWLNLGAARYALGEIEEAEFAHRQAMRLRAKSPEVRFNLALVLEARGDRAAALEEYGAAVEFGLKDEAGLWSIARLQSELGDAVGAEETLRRLAERGKDGKDAVAVWFELGCLLLDRGDASGAEDAFARCVRRKNNWWQAHVNLALARIRNGRASESLRAIERAHELAPGEPAVLRAEAVAVVALGDGKRAAAVRRSLKEMGEPTPQLTFNLGIWLEAEGRLDDAIRAYSEALKEQPTMSEALINLAYVLERTGRREEAGQCWKRLLAMKPELAENYFDEAAASA
jgi:Flp pilus assembly protein TadD